MFCKFFIEERFTNTKHSIETLMRRLQAALLEKNKFSVREKPMLCTFFRNFGTAVQFFTNEKKQTQIPNKFFSKLLHEKKKFIGSLIRRI